MLSDSGPLNLNAGHRQSISCGQAAWAIFGEFREARDLLEAAEEQLTRTVGLAELGKLHCTRARVELAAGDAVTAVATLSKAEAIAAELKVKPDHELGKAIAEARALINRYSCAPAGRTALKPSRAARGWSRRAHFARMSSAWRTQSDHIGPSTPLWPH